MASATRRPVRGRSGRHPFDASLRPEHGGSEPAFLVLQIVAHFFAQARQRRVRLLQRLGQIGEPLDDHAVDPRLMGQIRPQQALHQHLGPGEPATDFDPRVDHPGEVFELAGMVAKILGPERFPARQGAETLVEFPGSGFEQPRVQTVGGHPALLAKISRSSAHDIPAVVQYRNRGRVRAKCRHAPRRLRILVTDSGRVHPSSVRAALDRLLHFGSLPERT